MGEFIWRLETESGLGVYRGTRLIGPSIFHGLKCPAPWGDRHKKLGATLESLLLDGGQRHIFGFRSLTQARNWFDDAGILDYWRKCGEDIHLAAFRRESCSDIWEGEKQVMFIRPNRLRASHGRVLLGIGDLHGVSIKENTARVRSLFEAKLHDALTETRAEMVVVSPVHAISL